ncbi:MAG: SUMF1/EgtB/PvdO family nonheme iron enzyme [Anaerolineae bacterium]|nr:SUMF1/EgtB/PvdO family nonheme iron enzyme [Anaerolineae bacterium]
MGKQYNLINIRTLLKEGFSDAELRDFCFDTPDFRPVYDQLAQNTGKAELVRLLLEYAHQKVKLEPLLAWAETANPAQFKAHQPYFKDNPPPSDADPPLSYLSALRTPAPVPPPASSPASPPLPESSPMSSSSPHRLTASSPLRVFLCHTAADKPAVRDLYHRLRADGFEPWLDEEDLLPGQKWQKEIPKAVAASDVVIVCLSQAALTRAGYVQEEIKFALDVADQQPENSIFLIPLRLEECDVPHRLQGLHWVNLFDEKGYGRLVRGLRLKAEAKAKAKEEIKPAVEETPARPKAKTSGDAYVSPIIQSPTPDPQPPTPDRLPFEPEMILISAGEFLMGSDPKKDKQAQEEEQPQHTLYLPDYYMAKTPVTNVQYAAFVQATGHHAPQVNENWAKPYNWNGQTPPQGKENHPVVVVSWDDAAAYCRWLAGATGKPYRLPTEAEWEKGARGTDGRIYPWGNQWDAQRCNSSEGGQGGTTPVDAYPAGASPYGLLDMAGNVWEWCSTVWQEKAYPFQVQDEWTKAYLDRTNVLRVLRGGAFSLDGDYARCAIRFKGDPDSRGYFVGFRAVVSPHFVVGILES